MTLVVHRRWIVSIKGNHGQSRVSTKQSCDKNTVLFICPSQDATCGQHQEVIHIFITSLQQLFQFHVIQSDLFISGWRSLNIFEGVHVNSPSQKGHNESPGYYM